MAQITGGPHRGHAAGDNDAEKAASQLVSDIKYKVGKELGKATNLNPAQVAQKYMEKLNSSPASGPVKAIAKKKLGGGLNEKYGIGKLVQESVVNALNKVFVEGIEEPEVQNEYLLQLEELEEKKYKIRVTDKKTGNNYIRTATRAKIAELRINPNISSVEMTKYGESSETEKTKGEKTAKVKSGQGLDPVGKEDADVNNNGIKNDKSDKYLLKRRAAVGNAIANEEFIGEVTDKKPEKNGDKKVNNTKYVNLKPTLGGTMESVEVTPKPSALQNFQTQQKPNSEEQQKIKLRQKQVQASLNRQRQTMQLQKTGRLPLNYSDDYTPEGELVDEKLTTQHGNSNKLSQSSQRKSLGRSSSIKDGSKPSGYESPKEFRDTEIKYQKNSFEPEGKVVSEEESDRRNDAAMERGGSNPRQSYNPNNTPAKKRTPEEIKQKGKEVMDKVRQSITARYGKGALM